jgi:hypothetical protein
MTQQAVLALLLTLAGILPGPLDAQGKHPCSRAPREHLTHPPGEGLALT